MSVSTRGYTVDKASSGEHEGETFETLSTLLQSVSAAYRTRMSDTLMSKLEALAKEQEKE